MNIHLPADICSGLPGHTARLLGDPELQKTDNKSQQRDHNCGICILDGTGQFQETSQSLCRFHRFFENSGSAMLLIEPDEGVIVAANNAASKYYGYSRQRLAGMSIAEINTLPIEEIAAERMRALREERSFFNFSHRLASGEVRAVQVHSAPIEAEGKLFLYSIVHDVTEWKASQAALRASEERYRTVFHMSLDAIAISRQDDETYIDINQSFLEIIGYDRGEVIGKTRGAANIWVDQVARQKMLGMLRAGSPCRNLETLFRRKNGEIFWGVLSASLVEINGTICALTMVRDISERKKAEEEIRSLAFYDPLTGLVNRRLFLDRLQEVAVRSKRNTHKHALLFIDLDNFKPLNDLFGHNMGDLLLQTVAARLLSCVRRSDTVARFGGDEFVVMLENLGTKSPSAMTQARTVGEKIRAALAETYHLGNQEWTCSASIGIAVFGEPPVDIHEVLQQADQAMYHAKAEGRNAVRLFTDSLGDPAAESK